MSVNLYRLRPKDQSKVNHYTDSLSSALGNFPQSMHEPVGRILSEMPVGHFTVEESTGLHIERVA